MLDVLPFLDTLPTLGGYGPYVLGIIATWAGFGLHRRWREGSSRARWRRAIDGSDEPPSLHPLIDPVRCIGCGACASACPEGRIIGLIGGKAQLVDPASCIGHGACKAACPAGAIDLVFGTARRGVDIPLVSPSFETNVPGLFIAGELGGMGLIANAVEQGRQAIQSISRLDALGRKGVWDVVIVGAGPAGLAASLAAKEAGLAALSLEQDTLGGAVAHYPRGKIVMTRPAHLPLHGRVKLRRVRKERLIELWTRIVRKTGVAVHTSVRVEAITPTGWGFDVATTAGTFPARAVLLATGRRGSPRRLAVPGEELPKVVYRLTDARDYRGAHVLVVGGGDSALEAAAELARHPVASLTLCHRGEAFARAKPINRRRIEEAVARRRITVLFGAEVRAIEPARVTIEQNGRRFAIANDAVIVCAGGLLPTALLSTVGVTVETKYGTR